LDFHIPGCVLSWLEGCQSVLMANSIVSGNCSIHARNRVSQPARFIVAILPLRWMILIASSLTHIKNMFSILIKLFSFYGLQYVTYISYFKTNIFGITLITPRYRHAVNNHSFIFLLYIDVPITKVDSHRKKILPFIYSVHNSIFQFGLTIIYSIPLSNCNRFFRIIVREAITKYIETRDNTSVHSKYRGKQLKSTPKSLNPNVGDLRVVGDRVKHEVREFRLKRVNVRSTEENTKIVSDWILLSRPPRGICANFV